MWAFSGSGMYPDAVTDEVSALGLGDGAHWGLGRQEVGHTQAQSDRVVCDVGVPDLNPH